MTVRRRMNPLRGFDEHFENLVKLAVSQGLTISVIDLQQCAKDVVDQRQERAAHDELAAQYKRVHARFGIAQADRYRRYVQLLNAIRGIYRYDTEMIAALAQFRRKRSRGTSVESSPPAQASA